MKKIECRYCGWSWDESDGEDDKYLCHICDNDNSRFYDKIFESEQPKNKLFIPRKLSGEDSRWSDWNKMQPIVDGERINQFDINTGKKEGIWEAYRDNGQLYYKCSYNNDERDGYWEGYHSNGQLMYKGSFKNDLRDGYWEGYHSNGQLMSKGSFKNGEIDGYWEEYFDNGQLMSKDLYKNGELVKKLPLTESEQPKKKLFIPRRVDERWDDLLKSMITTDYNIGPYLNRRGSYKDLSKSLDPLVMKLSKGDLITFVKANPFWLDSLDKIKYLFNTLNYNENKEIAENHIGQTFSKGSFYTTPELKYYESKFKKPKNSKIDTYVFIGSDEFVEVGEGKFKKMLDIERLMKVSVDNWKDISDYGFGGMIKMMILRANANNKQLYKITANKGLLDEYEGKSGSEMPDYILSAINQKKEKF
jgi:hypothetical protein